MSWFNKFNDAKKACGQFVLDARNGVAWMFGKPPITRNLVEEYLPTAHENNPALDVATELSRRVAERIREAGVAQGIGTAAGGVAQGIGTAYAGRRVEAGLGTLAQGVFAGGIFQGIGTFLGGIAQGVGAYYHGKSVESGLQQHGQHVENGLQQHGRHVENGLQQHAQSITRHGQHVENGLQQLGQHVDNGLQQLGQHVENGLQEHAKSIECCSEVGEGFLWFVMLLPLLVLLFFDVRQQVLGKTFAAFDQWLVRIIDESRFGMVPTFYFASMDPIRGFALEVYVEVIGYFLARGFGICTYLWAISRGAPETLRENYIHLKSRVAIFCFAMISMTGVLCLGNCFHAYLTRTSTHSIWMLDVACWSMLCVVSVWLACRLFVAHTEFPQDGPAPKRRRREPFPRDAEDEPPRRRQRIT